jgi:hypothetical protein
MKLKLTQAGFETYTGQMGVVFFENGLSVNDVLPIDAIRIAAAVGAEWEDGSAANVGEMYLNNMHNPAHVGNDINTMSMPVEGKEEQPAPKEDDGKTDTTSVQASHLTREELEAIADEKGIAGLREVAEPLKVKGTSIVALMDAIIKAQLKLNEQKAD